MLLAAPLSNRRSTRVHEAKDMALKLRHIHDALQGEVKRKTKRLIEIKRGVEERNSQVSRRIILYTLIFHNLRQVFSRHNFVHLGLHQRGVTHALY